MSDTPRTDAAEYESQDEPVAKLGSVDVDFARQLERELNAANDMFRKLNIHALNLTERIKRLEEENDAMRADLLLWRDTTDLMCSKAGIGFTTEAKL